jgi:xanthine dehydrogenase accessory factor
MIVSADGNIAGSVSGGCVEGAVIETATEILETGQAQLLHFGVADETAWDVGLACGGSIDVLVERLDMPSYELVHRLRESRRSGTIVTVVRGSGELVGKKLIIDEAGATGGNLPAELVDTVHAMTAAISESKMISLDAETDIFVDVLRPSPTLVAVGGVDIAIALTGLADVLGYHTVVVDPRRAFGSDTRFPHVDQLIQAWPKAAFTELTLTPDTAVALLTHDPKIDDPALEILLASDVFYIGALGSRKTHTRRLERLAKMGCSEAQIDRIFAPIGLDIGAANPQEIALSIMAEIVAVRRGQSQMVAR